MIKIAVVGTGKIACEILPQLVDMKELSLEAICGTARSAAKVKALQDQYGIKESYTDYGEMLASCKVDVVYLAVPNHLHYPMAKQGLEAGFGVFVEKPFTLSYKESQELVELARTRKLFLLEAISNQYLPIYEALKQALPKVGDIKFAEFNFSQYSSRYDQFLAGEYFPVFDPSVGGGALYDLNVYNLHGAVGLFGLPETVTYEKNIVKGVDTSGLVTLKYKDFFVTCIGAKDCQGPSQILIQGTKGYLRIQAPSNTMMAPLEFYGLGAKTPETIFVPDISCHRMRYEFAALADLVKNGRTEDCRLRQEETLQVSRLLSMCQE